jgi:hypothetical protein
MIFTVLSIEEDINVIQKAKWYSHTFPPTTAAVSEGDKKEFGGIIIYWIN